MVGIGIAEEQPVLLSDGGRSNSVFRQIVVELDSTVFEIDTQQRPIGECVIDGLAESGARKTTARLF